MRDSVRVAAMLAGKMKQIRERLGRGGMGGKKSRRQRKRTKRTRGVG
jgi:hypothetical protein